MKRLNVLRNNKGASLVLVIVAMLFVGLIATIVLTLTVGNSKATKATIDTSENFYSSESLLDDLQVYFKKLATSAATDAYAKTLEKVGTGVVLENEFDTNFKAQITQKLNDILGDASKVDSASKTFTSTFLNNSVTYGRGGTGVSIKYGSLTTDSNGNPVLKDVVITFVDESGYETTITTDISFSAKMPNLGTLDSSGEFSYGIDHFVMISGGSINPGNKYLKGNITGGIYAKEYLKIKTDPSTNSNLTLAAHYILVGKDILVDKGTQTADGSTLTIRPIADRNIIRKNGSIFPCEVWCDSIKVGDAKVKIETATEEGVSGALETNLYLRKNLELNGQEAEFVANGGTFNGYSKSDATYVTNAEAPVSSAIILNGLGAKLDLSGLSSLNIAGKAYTSMSDLEGVYNMFSDSSSEPTTGISYFTQGESITYRALQALYLIPGDYITGIGHNPMTLDEYNHISSLEIPTSIQPLLSSSYIKEQRIRYLSGDTYVYLFWDFKSTADAVTYFNQMTNDGVKRYEGLLKKQIGLLGSNNGYIKLPTNCTMNGNAIAFNGSALSTKTGSSIDLSNCVTWQQGYMTTLDKDVVKGTDLLSNLFKGGLSSTIAVESFSKDFEVGPLQDNIIDGKTIQYSYVDKSGNTIAYNETGSEKTRVYRLITGPNVVLNTIDYDKTYIIITPGNVTINATTSGTAKLRCMIIAGGDIILPEGLNMECLGMVQRKKYVAGVQEGEEELISEFQALLGTVKDDSDNSFANTRLRMIFNVANTSDHAGDGDEDDIVVISMTEWKRN